MTALIVVDVQHDFIDGSLALRNCPAKQEGADVVPVINKLIKDGRFDEVIYSLDWHPKTHISFVNNVDKYPLDDTCAVSLESYNYGAWLGWCNTTVLIIHTSTGKLMTNEYIISETS